MSIESVMPSNHLILCRPLLPSIFPRIRVFPNESVLCIRWPEYWSFTFSISPSNEYSGLISFRMDWLDLLAVQETLKSLPQHDNSRASILQCSAFFLVQLSHPYMTIGKTIALTRRTFVGKVMSLLWNMLSKLVIIFLPRCAAIHGVAKSRTRLSNWTELNWTELKESIPLAILTVLGCFVFHRLQSYREYSKTSEFHDHGHIAIVHWPWAHCYSSLTFSWMPQIESMVWKYHASKTFHKFRNIGGRSMMSREGQSISRASLSRTAKCHSFHDGRNPI